MYLSVSSSFGGGQDPPLHTIVFIMELLCASRILHSKIMWSDVCCASLQGKWGRLLGEICVDKLRFSMPSDECCEFGCYREFCF